MAFIFLKQVLTRHKVTNLYLSRLGEEQGLLLPATNLQWHLIPNVPVCCLFGKCQDSCFQWATSALSGRVKSENDQRGSRGSVFTRPQSSNWYPTSEFASLYFSTVNTQAQKKCRLPACDECVSFPPPPTPPNEYVTSVQHFIAVRPVCHLRWKPLIATRPVYDNFIATQLVSSFHSHTTSQSSFHSRATSLSSFYSHTTSLSIIL